MSRHFNGMSKRRSHPDLPNFMRLRLEYKYAPLDFQQAEKIAKRMQNPKEQVNKSGPQPRNPCYVTHRAIVLCTYNNRGDMKPCEKYVREHQRCISETEGVDKAKPDIRKIDARPNFREMLKTDVFEGQWTEKNRNHMFWFDKVPSDHGQATSFQFKKSK